MIFGRASLSIMVFVLGAGKLERTVIGTDSLRYSRDRVDWAVGSLVYFLRTLLLSGELFDR